MKKIYFATGVLLISMCMLLACENKNASQGDSKKAEQSKQATEAPKDAKVATAENGKHTESNDVTVDVQKYHNTEKIVSENDYAISSDLQDMSEEAQEIVEAKIRTFQYVVIDGDAWTKIELDIQNSLSGTLKKGDSITLDRTNFRLYKKLIEWEQQGSLQYKDSTIFLNGTPINGYRFQKNYYFMAGDNGMNSQDSRYWGLLPEEYIVGKAWIIWKSVDPYTDKFRWNRFLKVIH